MSRTIKQILIDQGGKLSKDGWEFEGNCDISDLGLEKLPKFHYVKGSFYCYSNNLTSLEGCPQSIGGDFYCHDNNLTSLEYHPLIIKGRRINIENNNFPKDKKLYVHQNNVFIGLV